MPIPFGVKLLGVQENSRLLPWLLSRYREARNTWAANPSCSPDDVPNPYFSLGTRPDVIEWVWKDIQRTVPSSRRWVAMGTPVLVHPDSEIVFMFAMGTGYAIRLPEEARAQAIAVGAKRSIGRMDLTAVTDDWVVGMGSKDKPEWWLSAFESASK